jgi:imidazoleglycerol phosphate dehydratase HisB
MSYSPRTASVTRKTNETSIQITLNLDATPGSGIRQEIDIKTGVGFLDHVRALFGFFSLYRTHSGSCRCSMP